MTITLCSTIIIIIIIDTVLLYFKNTYVDDYLD